MGVCGRGEGVSSFYLPQLYKYHVSAHLRSSHQSAVLIAWVLVSSLLRVTLIGPPICQKYKLVSSCLSEVIGACDLWATAEWWACLTWALLDEQWCEPAFNLIFIHIWPCPIIYAALSNRQCSRKINDIQTMCHCLILEVLWIPVTSFLAHTPCDKLVFHSSPHTFLAHWDCVAQP